jgi:hypothetical protein
VTSRQEQKDGGVGILAAVFPSRAFCGQEPTGSLAQIVQILTLVCCGSARMAS